MISEIGCLIVFDITIVICSLIFILNPSKYNLIGSRETFILLVLITFMLTPIISIIMLRQAVKEQVNRKFAKVWEHHGWVPTLLLIWGACDNEAPDAMTALTILMAVRLFKNVTILAMLALILPLFIISAIFCRRQNENT